MSTRDPDLEDVFLSLIVGASRKLREASTADVLIVGSGAAGLTAALNLAETHKVAVIAKGALGDRRHAPGRRAGSPRCSRKATASKRMSTTR